MSLQLQRAALLRSEITSATYDKIKIFSSFLNRQRGSREDSAHESAARDR